MIKWTEFKDKLPQVDKDGKDPSLLIAEPTTFIGIPTFNIYKSSWRSGNGCYTNEYGNYTKPTDGVFWAVLNNPYPTMI